MKVPIHADQTSFKREVIDSADPVLVDFWSDRSVPCQAMAPVLEEILQEHQGTLRVVKVNVDQNPALAKHYHVETLPTLIYFMNGLVHDQIIGVVGKQEIVQRLRAAR